MHFLLYTAVYVNPLLNTKVAMTESRPLMGSAGYCVGLSCGSWWVLFCPLGFVPTSFVGMEILVLLAVCASVPPTCDRNVPLPVAAS